MASKDDWFREPCLSEESRTEFERRLSRARSSRPEYLRIQAHSLLSAGSFDSALDLVDRIRADHPDHLTAWILEQRGDCLRALRRSGEAIEAYVQALEEMKRDRGLLGNAHFSLAELVCEINRDDLYERTLGYLTEFWDSAPLFPAHEMQQFGWTAILLDRLGQSEEAKPPARRALAAVAKQRSKAANHPTLGLVGDSHPEMRRELERIVGSAFQSDPLGARNLLSTVKAAVTKFFG